MAADLDFTPTQPRRFAVAVSNFKRIAAEFVPDVIHSHFVTTTLVARVALRGADSPARVFQVPGPLHLEHRGSRRVEIATARGADYWIGSCRWTVERYRTSGISPSRVFLSYYGTELARLETARTAVFRRDLDVRADVPLVGMVAYIYAPKRLLGQTRGLKGHEDFIDAFALLLRKRPDARAVIVGGPWNGATGYERRLRSRARRAVGDRLVFTGPRTDVPAVYADLDLAVHPSLSENCGGAVESLAAACPTVATSVGGLPDVVIDGETGWLVPPRDPRHLAETMLEALGDRDEARRRAAAGQALVRRLFDVERTGREIASIYEEILSGRTAGPKGGEAEAWAVASSA